MGVRLPTDPKERIKAMVRVVRGEMVTYKVNGKDVTLAPSGEVNVKSEANKSGGKAPKK